MLKIRFTHPVLIAFMHVADEGIWKYLNDLLKMFIAGKSTPQYKWLEKEFLKVNRTETPWFIVLMHCPFYSSYVHHYMEGETLRVMYEPWFVEYKVDVVFSGHVHAYERSERISNIAYSIVNGLCTPIKDPSAPVYITIGDRGNLEGLVTEMMEPQPTYSAYREASFGHGILDVKNRTHAYFGWQRNQDGYAVETDSLWLKNRYWSVLESEELYVHITQGDTDGRGLIISWITPDEPGSSSVLYCSENSKHKNRAEGVFVRYKFFNYTSVTFITASSRTWRYPSSLSVVNQYNSKYIYEIGIGHLGQPHDSNVTLTHYESNPKKWETVLFLVDLSCSNDYPFHDNTRWDTWG
ncbi:Purple acid phosphatase [Hibiscus syriacus]|uniref:Purple acid phosphatase n=1 Tax=Hibiscus syriacus TaxID=106335 RepID=A0A6A2WWW7_HIBSY|nr:Purple acid phosphatase [Hibiscus syriacus]